MDVVTLPLSRRRFLKSLVLPGVAALLPSSFAAMNRPQAHLFKDAGTIPNNPILPVLIYAQAMPHDAEAIERTLERNGWRPAWRYGVYSFPHYHSTAHEVLGVYRGSAHLRLGHSAGEVFEVRAGDVIVIPAGVGHENIEASDDFHVVGGYPPGQSADLLRGRPGERPGAEARIAAVPLPVTDPVHGAGGPLTELWKASAD
jgi:Uncharacterized protein containing double-stranded beta helix domain